MGGDRLSGIVVFWSKRLGAGTLLGADRLLREVRRSELAAGLRDLVAGQEVTFRPDGALYPIARAVRAAPAAPAAPEPQPA
jgi:hypothetical protein